MKTYSLTRWNFSGAYCDTFRAKDDQAAIAYVKRFIKSNQNARLYSLETKTIIYSQKYN